MREKPVVLQCEQCGGSFERYASYLKLPRRGRFCSRGCQQIARRKGATQERQCVVCQTTFSVGGRGRGLRGQRFCSLDCQRAGRYRRGSKAKDFSHKIGWVAGLIDGEGSIMLHPRRDAVALRVTVSNSHRPTLERFVELTGIGAVIWNAKRVTEKHRASGWWLVNGEAAESVLRQALAEIFTKKEQATIAISFQERLRTPAFKADRSWQLEYLKRMRRLNRRGP